MKYFIRFIFTAFIFASLTYGQRNQSLIESKRTNARSSASPSFEQTTLEPPPEFANRNATGKSDSPFTIILKPRALYPSQDHGSICVRGSVLLKIELLADGTIGRVVVVRGLPHGLNEKAVEAARKIIFIPEVRNGKFVSVLNTFDYSFSIY